MSGPPISKLIPPPVPDVLNFANIVAPVVVSTVGPKYNSRLELVVVSEFSQKYSHRDKFLKCGDLVFHLIFLIR